MMHENQKRSLLKTVTWRLLGTMVTTAVAYFLTKKIALSAVIGGSELLFKSFLYFFHERIWNSVKFGRVDIEPKVIWLTGLSGAGKTTIALELVEKLRAQGHKVEHLDGDTIRNIFPDTGFSLADRMQHIRKIGFLASKLESHGITVVASFISPQKEARSFVRQLCRQFIEVYVSTPLEVCEARDPKGLYARARSGEIKNFTGIDSPYEAPHQPEIVVETSSQKVETSLQNIFDQIDFL